ncbi:MAG TPA: DNA methyltransferase [Bryobacteraceae bacterium]|jgi:site-specific DNA-methyltransferase (adenine-specific)
MPDWKNKLFFGDNLRILREHVPDESVDLVYLDPPFNSNANYNVLFKEKSGQSSHAQITAFEDTWEWGDEAEETYYETIQQSGRLADFLQAFRTILGPSDMMAYLVMMAPRLHELHRVLKDTGSIYLHCDPTASHYLKLLMDAIFEPERFIAEIIWKRTNARGTTGKWPRIHDVILVFAKSETFRFHSLKVKADKAKLPHTLITIDGVKYQTYELTGPGITKEGESGKPWRGFDPTKFGRHWADSQMEMDAWDADALIHWAKDGFPRRRDAEPFDPDARMITVGTVWTDIDRINQSAKERLGYPTQKPEALLERIITASSNENDVVLDPFCGCGTSISVAERLHRKWIGIDITHLAITLIRSRLFDHFKSDLSPYEVIGDPKDLASAQALALESKHDGRYQFQFWAAGLVDARPANDQRKKGADSGIDGIINFIDDRSGQAKKVIVQVKSGHVKVGDIRDLKGVLDREKAAMGCFITLEEPTGPMKTEAVSAGFYESGVKLAGVSAEKFPKIQILTIAELLAGKKLNFPRHRMETFKQAERKSKSRDKQPGLFNDPERPF